MDEQTQKFLTTIAENVPKVKQQGYDEGRKAEYDAFWDACQYNGTRKDYKYAFSYNSWTSNNFYPKYDIKPTGANGTYMFAATGNLTIDLAERLEKQGVVLDLSGLTTSECEFYLSRITNLPTLDFSGCTSMTRTFDYWTGRKISLILSDSGETVFTTIFRRCSYLTDIVIESGTIGRNLHCADSPLNVESMKSIITHLKNYAGTDSEKSYTLTLKSSCKTELETAGFTDEDKRLLAENGITYSDNLTWVDVIDDLKWNLVWAS